MKSPRITFERALNRFALPTRWTRLLLIGIMVQAVMLSALGQERIEPQARIKALQAELSANPELNLNAAILDATREKMPSVVRWLLEKGASPNASDFITGDSLLHVTVGNEDLGSTLELLRFGGNVDCRNSEDKTPIELATNKTIREVLVYFRDHPVPLVAPIDLASRSENRGEGPTARNESSFVNSLEMKFQRIDAGTFRMGSKDSAADLGRLYQVDPKYFQGEQPTRKVNITKPYYLGIHEVTVGQFTAFVEQTRFRTDAERNPNLGEMISVSQSKLVRRQGGSWRDPGFKQEPNYPVVNVSWFDAQAFCKWLSKKEGKTYRLPTEAEWEYACRAGTSTRFSSGDQPSSLSESANVVDLSYRKTFPGSSNALPFTDGFVFTSPAGNYRPNEFGLYDMHGNVWEWCSDWYDASYYQRGITQDPTGPSRGERRVIRGGCWY